jgi:threonine dehydrogenase-like Zn-dependent dehydrogenase
MKQLGPDCHQENPTSMPVSQALWIVAARSATLRVTPFEVAEGSVKVATLFSGISRGTERLVFEGRVPESEWERMRCPLQEGAFPFPVKYGYAAVGTVLGGALEGQTVFVLHPHQTRFSAPLDMMTPIPAGVPAERAVLAANMETALNIVWDAQAGPGDRIAIIGAGVVGALAGWLCAQMPGVEATLVDTNEHRATLAAALGCGFARPDACPPDCDVVIHASGSPEGLKTALTATGMEARVVEASWYGDADVSVPLGAAFHSRRLTITSSQVGQVPPSRRIRWPSRRRLETALKLLADDRLDILISGEIDFADLPARYPDILADPATLCHRIRYS